MSGPNLDIYSYTTDELFQILDLENPTEESIKTETNKYIKKYTNTNASLAVFFTDMQTRLLQELDDGVDDRDSDDVETDMTAGADTSTGTSTAQQYQEDSTYNSSSDPGNAQTKDWWENQALGQNDSTQSSRNTDRKQKVNVFDNNHLPMNRQKLGINEAYDVQIRQGTMNPNLRNVVTKLVNIDSQFRQNLDHPSTDFTLDLSDPLTDVLSIGLYSVEIPYSWYTIDVAYGTNCFLIDSSNITIPSGNYSAEELVTEVSGAIIAAGFETGGASYNSNNGKVTLNIPNDSNVIFYSETLTCTSSACFNNNTNTGAMTNYNLGWILGFRDTSYNISESNQITSEAVIDVYGSKYFFIALDDYNQNHLNSGLVSVIDTDTTVSLPSYYSTDLSVNCQDGSVGGSTLVGPSAPRRITQAQMYTINEIIKNRENTTKNRTPAPTSTDTIAKIPIRVLGFKMGDPYIEFGGSFADLKRTYFGPVDIERLHVQLLDDKGNVVNLNNCEWSFTLISEHLYQY
jgi:hypothetical protein